MGGCAGENLQFCLLQLICVEEITQHHDALLQIPFGQAENVDSKLVGLSYTDISTYQGLCVATTEINVSDSEGCQKD